MNEFIEGNGYSGQTLFENVRSCQAYTFDDVILLPGYFYLLLFTSFYFFICLNLIYLKGYIDSESTEVSLESYVCRGIKLKVLILLLILIILIIIILLLLNNNNSFQWYHHLWIQ